jgi:hypothetical protein
VLLVVFVFAGYLLRLVRLLSGQARIQRQRYTQERRLWEYLRRKRSQVRSGQLFFKGV